jgi:hypothetical protein
MKNPSSLVKSISLWIAIAVVGSTLPGCSFFMDKNKKPETPPSLSMGGDTACLKDTKKVFTDYMDGNGSVEQMDGMFDCMVRAIDMFTKKTRGETADRYTLPEIQRFVINYFDQRDEFATRLIDIGFEIKSTAIGGRDIHVTREEIEKVKEMIISLKAGIRHLDPHMDILLGRIAEGTQVDPTRVEAAVKAQHEFVESFSSKLQSRDGAAVTMQRLFEAYNQLRTTESDAQLEAQAQERLRKLPQFISLLKSILISGPSDRVRCEEWPAILKAGSHMYAVFLRHKYVLKDKSLGEEGTMTSARALRNEVLDLLASAYDRHESKLIPYAKIKDLVYAYERSIGPLPMNIRASSLESILPKLFTNVLRTSRIDPYPNNYAEESRREVGFGEVEYKALRFYLINWFNGIDQIGAMLGGVDSRPGSQLRRWIEDEFANHDPNLPANAEKKSNPGWWAARKSLAQFNSILHQNGRPLVYVNVNEGTNNPAVFGPLIRPVNQDEQFTKRDLLKLNTTRLLVEIVFRSFTNDINRARSLRGLTTDEAEVLYKDMRKIGYDIGVADPRGQRAGHRTFMEANLFTSNADGNEYINYREGVEWFNFVAASSKHATEIFDSAYLAWRNDSIARGQAQAVERDIFGNLKVDISWFRRHFKAHFPRYFSNLPGMARYVQGLIQANRWLEFEVGLEEAARPVGHTQDMMDSSSIRTIVPILYYTESIFTRYDANHNGVLENQEAWEIFPIMKNTIRDISNGAAQTERIQKMVFAKLLLSGEPPPDDWRRFIDTPVAAIREWFTRPSIDRMGVIKLIAAIASTSRTNAIKAIKTIYDQNRGTLLQEFRAGSIVILDQLHDLNRCAPDSQENFRRIMQQHADSIFAPASGQEYDSTTFVRRIQTVIQRSAAIKEQCQPLLRLN